MRYCHRHVHQEVDLERAEHAVEHPLIPVEGKGREWKGRGEGKREESSSERNESAVNLNSISLESSGVRMVPQSCPELV